MDKQSYRNIIVFFSTEDVRCAFVFDFDGDRLHAWLERVV